MLNFAQLSEKNTWDLCFISLCPTNSKVKDLIRWEAVTYTDYIWGLRSHIESVHILVLWQANPVLTVPQFSDG